MSKILANEIANYGDNAPIDLKEGLNIPAGKPLQAAGSAGSSGQVLSSTGTSISWITPFDGSYNSLTNRPTIPAAQINSDWNASSGVAVILNKPSVPPLPSVTTASASGGGSLAYNSSNGQFTFTPADLSNASNWDTAYGWGDHGAAGYLTAETDTLATVTGRGASTTTGITLSTSNLILDSASDQRVQYNISGAETSKVIFRSTGALDFYSTNGMAFYASNAASPVNRRLTLLTAGGVQVEYQNSTRLETTAGGVTITGDIALGSGNLTTTGKLLYANHYDNLGDLPGASTYHGMFAHVHGTGKGYFAHAGAWTELLDVNSSMADLGDVDLTVAPTDGQVLKWEQSSGSWKAANDLTGGGGGGLALTDLSASNATASGGGSLSYNSGSGTFTFTPPDLSSYLTTETDPVFSASDAAAVTAAGIANWNTAYSWGNHAAQGYLVGYGGVSNHTDVNISGVQNGQILQYNGSDWVNITPSYISSYSETDTLQSVTDRGAITTNSIQTTGLLVDGASNAIDCAQGNITAGRTFQGFFTGTILAKEGKLTIVRRTSGNLVDISNTFGTTKTFVVDTNANLTLSGSLTAGGLTYPTTNGTSGQVLTSDGAGNVTWQNSSGGGVGASVTISDTAPAASAGDLWWESDTGRLKIYYQDTDTTQWVDTNPPLTQDRIASSSAPSSASDTGVPGDIRYDSSYVYICISNNTWKRAALATW